MFILLRRMERWLHQEVFKVGWLATHDYQTTTILYYTFFLPGVFIHEIIYWLVAGALGVRANRSLKWPDKQEIGELKLDFVQLSNRAGTIRKALISVAPMIFGLAFIWYIAANVFDIMSVVGMMSTGELGDVAAGVKLLIAAPLFWLWVYIIFTIANTMYPTVPKDLQGWRIIFLGIGAVTIVVLLLGIGGQVFEVLQNPLDEIIAVLQTMLFLLIGIDFVMVLVLGTIEYTIEHITGNSATIQGGKLVTVTRQEALEEREKARERERRRAERQRNRAATSGPSSVYLLPFSIPGAPGEEPITKVIEEETAKTVPEEKEEEPIKEVPASMPLFGGLAEREKPAPKEEESEEDIERRKSIASRINLPERRAPVLRPPETKSDEKPEEKASQEVAKPLQPSLLSDEEDKDEKAVPSATSRFGTSTFGRPKPAETEQDESTEKATPPAASHFGTSTFGQPKPPETEQDDSVEKAAPPAVSRFGTSTFGRPTPPETEQDKEKTDKDEDEAIVRREVVVGRPATASRFAQPDKEESEEEQEEKAKPATFTPRTTPFDVRKSESDDKDEEAASTSRFGASPFSRPKDDESKRPAASLGSLSRRPARDEDDDDEKLESSVLRQSRGKDAVSSLFSQLNDDEENEEESTSSPSSSFRRPIVGSGPSRFGTSRPAPKPNLSPVEDDEDEDDESASRPTSRFQRPSIGARPSRFGTSRPAPKPSTSHGEDDEDEENDDELVYEDIEDEYGDDDEYYEDDDDAVDDEDED